MFQFIMKVSSPASCILCVSCLLQLAVSWDRPSQSYSLGIRDRPAPALSRQDGRVLLPRKAQQGPELPRALKRSSLVRKTNKTKVTKYPVGLLKQQILSSISKSEPIPGVKVSD